VDPRAPREAGSGCKRACRKCRGAGDDQPGTCIFGGQDLQVDRSSAEKSGIRPFWEARATSLAGLCSHPILQANRMIVVSTRPNCLSRQHRYGPFGQIFALSDTVPPECVSCCCWAASAPAVSRTWSQSATKVVRRTGFSCRTVHSCAAASMATRRGEGFWPDKLADWWSLAEHDRSWQQGRKYDLGRRRIAA
jgi:hypothetical protein